MAFTRQIPSSRSGKPSSLGSIGSNATSPAIPTGNCSWFTTRSSKSTASGKKFARSHWIRYGEAIHWSIELEQLLALTEGKTPLLLDLKPVGLEDDVIVAITAMRADARRRVDFQHARPLTADDCRGGSGNAHRAQPWTLGSPGCQPGNGEPFSAGSKVFCRSFRYSCSASTSHATDLMLNYHICVPPLIKSMSLAGFRIYAWTPETTREFEILLSRGVDGIITHRPDRLIDTLARLGVPRL